MASRLSRKCLLGKLCYKLEVTADSYTYHERRTCIWTGCLNCLYNCFLNTLNSVGRLEHIKLTHILASEALRCYCYLKLISRYYIVVNDSRCIILSINSFKWISDYRFSQISVCVSTSYTFINCLSKTALYMELLSYLNEEDCHSCILTDWNPVLSCYIHVFCKLTENLFTKFTLFSISGTSYAAFHLR